MSDPEAPSTVREQPPPSAAGGIDPTPPDPGAWVVWRHPWPAVIVLAGGALAARQAPAQLAASLLLLVSAFLAALLARGDARHWPLAHGVLAVSSASIARALLATYVLHGGPYEGWLRAAFHVEQALYLVGTVAIPWMAAVTLRHPPGPSGRVQRAIVGATYGVLGALIAGYPELRGGGLLRVYLGAEIVAIFMALLAVVLWVRRRGWLPEASKMLRDHVAPNVLFDMYGGVRWYTWAPLVLIIGGDLVLLLVGAWRYGLFGAAYVVQQWGLVALWGGVAAQQVVALALRRRG